MFNKFKLYARYKGEKTDFYTHNKNYTLVVEVGKFNQIVKAHAIDRDTGEMLDGSGLHYEDKKLFDRNWRVLADKTEG